MGHMNEQLGELPPKRVWEGVLARVVEGDRITMSILELEPGTLVPEHAHENEQLTYILEGALRFWIGEEGSEDEEELVVRAGEVLHIPSHVAHKAEALEDTLDVDVFSPPRQDWLDGTDDYFRAGGEG